MIMKGLPGSGKTHIIRRIKKMYKNAVLCSADFYFMKDGQLVANLSFSQIILGFIGIQGKHIMILG